MPRRRRASDELALMRHTLESMQQRAAAERLDAADVRRRRRSTQLTIAAITGLTVLVLLLWALPAQPEVADPGRVGLALSGSDIGGAVEVDADFSAAVGARAAFELSLTRSEPRKAVGKETSTSFIFCGAVRHGLQLQELNHLPRSPLRNLPTSPVEFDSVLGARDDCTYTTVKWTGLQVVLHGVTDARDVDVSGKRVRYAFPGIVTLPVAQPLDGQEVRPLPRGTTVATRLWDAPSDLEVVDASPQFSARGNLTWTSTFNSATAAPPLLYSVTGTLSDRENLTDAALFAAGVFGGLAVTATLSAAESLFEVRRRRDRKP